MESLRPWITHVLQAISSVSNKLEESGQIDRSPFIYWSGVGQNSDSHFSKKWLFQELPKAIGEEEFRTIKALSAKKKNKLSPEALSELWRIGLKAARRTLKTTTHTCIHTTGNLPRRFKTDKAHMRYKKLSTCEGSFMFILSLQKSSRLGDTLVEIYILQH